MNGASRRPASGCRVPPGWGGPLTESDLAGLAQSWITPEHAAEALLRRVSSEEGRQVVGQKGKGDFAGILIPYFLPDAADAITYRLRRDKPDVQFDKNGKPRPHKKYVCAPGSGNRLYFPPGVTREQLNEKTLPIVLVEGEKKALALSRLARFETDAPRFVPVAISGVWNWRGVIGKAGGPNGERLDVKGPIPDLDLITWSGRKVIIIFDGNVLTNESVKAARTRIATELARRGAKVEYLNLPPGCEVNGIDDLLAARGPRNVLELFDSCVSGAHLDVIPAPQFQARPDGIFRFSGRGDPLEQRQLTNFTAQITANVRLDDGVDIRHEFELEAELLGRRDTFTINAADFNRMEWPIERMGSGAITFPNQKDYARAAIQSFSLTAEQHSIYTHTGWRQIDGRWVYLHAGGGLSGSGALGGVRVRLPGSITRYELPASYDSEDLGSAVRASLKLTGLGPADVSFPLLAATYRAVFGDADFAIHLAGETGAFKSEVAALLQQHFGAGMIRVHLPANWSSTANALEAVAFYAKDTLLVIDDFAPQGSFSDVGRLNATAERLFRAAGNRSGRGRLDSTATLRNSKPPRSLILSTGEDIPRGHSIRARLLILELSRGSIDPSKLSECQRNASAGLYARAMSGFISWLALDYEPKRTLFENRTSEWKQRALGNAAHARTPDIVASLQAGFEMLLDFAAESGAVDGDEKRALSERCWIALSQAAAAQTRYHGESEPVGRFLELIRSLLACGGAHLEARDGGTPTLVARACGWKSDNAGVPRGDCIGWVDDDDLYLDSGAAYRAVQKAARDSGEPLPVSEQTLRKRLRDKGRLVATDEARGTLTVRRKIAGVQREVLHLRVSEIAPVNETGD